MHAVPPFRFAPGSARRLTAVAEAVLWLLLALQAARLAWILLEPAGPLGAPAAVTAAGDGGASTLRLATLGDPFYRGGDRGGDAAAAGLDGYRLHGVRVDAQRSTAILGHDGRQRAYRVGDRIAAGVVLEAVAGDHALLRTAQGTVRLELRTPEPAAGAPARALPAGNAATDGDRGHDGRHAGGGVAPAQLIAQAGLRAHEDGGYTLIPRGDDTALRAAGLRAGDVLLAVDGQPLTPERLAELQQHLSGRAGASLRVRRDGVVRTVAVGGAGE